MQGLRGQGSLILRSGRARGLLAES